MAKQVSCINNRGVQYAEHERISHIGGSWGKHAEAVAIANIKAGTDSYYVSVNGKSVDVIVANHQGRPYLKTTADGYAPNNLLNLPECK